MLSSVLRGVVRTGVAAVGASSLSLGVGKRAVEKCFRICLDKMGYVSREEFEALREVVMRTEAQNKEKESPASDEDNKK